MRQSIQEVFTDIRMSFLWSLQYIATPRRVLCLLLATPMTHSHFHQQSLMSFLRNIISVIDHLQEDSNHFSSQTSLKPTSYSSFDTGFSSFGNLCHRIMHVSAENLPPDWHFFLEVLDQAGMCMTTFRIF